MGLINRIFLTIVLAVVVLLPGTAAAGALSFVWGGNPPIAETSAGVAGKYSKQSIWLMSLYTRW
jgi:hypothetical protein